jgi:lipopolysaccharide export system ATP-binding protein
MSEKSTETAENMGENAQDGLRLVESGKGLVVSLIGKSFNKRPVVRSVSLSLKRGEAVGLLGPNGAGKTTCFYMITGLIPADTGSIEVDGHDVTKLPMYRRARLGIGYLPQEASIFRGLTAEQNIRATAELLEPDGARLEAMVEALLAEFGITHIRNTPAVALSGGERRRVEIARALATNPSFILLDEPFAGVDPIAVLEIQKIVKFLKQRNIGVLITDHNVRETLGICDHAYIISDGSVLAAGAPGDIIENENVRRVYLGEHFRM